MDEVRVISERIVSGSSLVVLTGAGISAESGIPTFRGPEGFWTLGSKEYRPEEMATFKMFQRAPEGVWQWYLYRLGICRGAGPNPAHLALATLETQLADRILLITQNVDGLHLRAGSTAQRTYQIHGNIEFVRCIAECDGEIRPLPADVEPKGRDELLTDGERKALKCPACGAWLRPHVLWFDEFYDEPRYRFNSSLTAAVEADVLIIVGTSGATNLPMQVGAIAARNGALLVDINPDPNPFSELAIKNGGYFLRGPAGEILPRMAQAVSDL